MQHHTLTGISQTQTMMSLLVQLSHAVRLNDTSRVISSLARLANCALDTGYVRDKKLVDWLDVVSIDAAVNVLFDIVEECAAGVTDSYSELYYLCTQLTCKILNGHTDYMITQEVPMPHDRWPTDYS